MKKQIFTLLLALILCSSYAQTILWKQLSSLPQGYRNGEAVTLNDKIYFVAGFPVDNYGTRHFYLFDPTTNIWTRKADVPVALQNLALAAVNGKIYAIGGDEFRSTNFEYTPETNAWRTLSAMLTARQHIDCGIFENKIYVMGGLTSWETITKKNEVYDIVTNTWSVKTDIPSLRNNAAIVTLDSLIFVIGGAGTPGDVWANIPTVESYNIKTDKWTNKANLPYPLFKPGAVTVKNTIVVLGGVATINGKDVNINKTLVYKRETDKWIESTPFPLPEGNTFFGCTSINNKIYVIAGMSGLLPNYGIYSTVYEGELITPVDVNPADESKVSVSPNPFQN